MWKSTKWIVARPEVTEVSQLVVSAVVTSLIALSGLITKES